MIKNIISILVVISFGFIAGFALLHPGLPPTHDGEYHVIRFYEFDKVLRDGNYYPRWAPDLNYALGVPLFNYVYPFPNYFASLLHLFGSSFIDAFKLNMFFATIIGAIFFYLWARIFWGNIGGIISSILYTFSPYHFLDIYIRGSVGEIWALAFFPAFLWTITVFINEQNKKFAALSSIFLALTIFSHNISSLMFFIFAVFYILLLIIQPTNRKFIILNSLFIIHLGLGLSAIFWLPALVESKYVTGLQIYNIAENFPDLYQLLIPSWGTGFSATNLGNQMSFQIGIANLLAIFLSAIVLFFIDNRSSSKKNKSEIRNPKRETNSNYQNSKIQNNSLSHKKIIIFFLFWFLIVFFLMQKISFPVWKMIPLMNYFQFPWRFLSLEILIASFLGGGSIYFFKSSIKKYIIAISIISISVLLNIDYAQPAYYHYRNDNYYLTRANFIYGTNSIGDYFNTIWTKKASGLQKRKLQENANITIFSESLKTTYYKFNISVRKDTQITVNTAYFPGWKATVDNRVIFAEPNKEGLISFPVSKGEHLIEVKLADTLIQTISKIISVLSIVLVFSIMISFKYKAVLKLKK